MKKIIAFDLDGTLISSSASSKAHKQWFKVMADLLDDPSVNELADKKDYFPDLLDVMSRLTGLRKEDGFDKSTMISYARNLFQMLYLAELRKQGKDALYPDMLDMIVDLKSECRLALITASPEDMVLPALEIMGVKKMFDYVYRSPVNQEPSKLEVMKKFVRDIGKPALYVGNEKKDEEACKELGIKFALAKWGTHDADASGNYNLTNPKQLKGILDIL